MRNIEFQIVFLATSWFNFSLESDKDNSKVIIIMAILTIFHISVYIKHSYFLFSVEKVTNLQNEEGGLMDINIKACKDLQKI